MIVSSGEREARKIRIMEACFDCYCERGLNETGMKALGKACGMNHSSFYNYFESLDELIVQATAHCMETVADELMEKALSYCPKEAPAALETVFRLMREMPRWAAKRYATKCRFMYQVYSSPKYLDDGRAFFAGMSRRYADYAGQLAQKVGISQKTMQSVILAFARAVAHYAMFGGEDDLNGQIDMLTGLLLAEKARTGM